MGNIFVTPWLEVTGAVARLNEAVEGLEINEHDLKITSFAVGLAETVKFRVTSSQSGNSGSFPQNL